MAVLSSPPKNDDVVQASCDHLDAQPEAALRAVPPSHNPKELAQQQYATLWDTDQKIYEVRIEVQSLLKGLFHPNINQENVTKTLLEQKHLIKQLTAGALIPETDAISIFQHHITESAKKLLAFIDASVDKINQQA